MKHLFIILVFTGVLIQNLSNIYILINFKINQDYIAKNLCIKKEEANNCCMGGCHLTKQLAEETKKEKEPASTIKLVKDVQLFCQVQTLKLNIPSFVKAKFAAYPLFTETDFCDTAFHPPC